MPSSRAAADTPLAAGQLLAGRYRLTRRLPGRVGPGGLWHAVDEVLARPVAVRAVPTGPSTAVSSAQGRALLDAAARAGAVAHPGLVRTYDATAAAHPDSGGTLAVVVCEWVEGRRLDDVLADGPLDPPEVADLVGQAAGALTALHRAGLAHGGVHPGNVLLTDDGRVRLTGAQVSPALAGAPEPDVRGDTRDLAAIGYALLTGCWPATATDQPGGRLRPAPVVSGRAGRPHAVRAAVPRALDAVVIRGLDPLALPGTPAITTPGALAGEVSQVVDQLRDAEQVRAERRPSRPRRLLPWAAVLALLVAVGITGWLLGLAVGDLPRRDDAVDAVVSTDAPTASAAPASPAGPSPVDLTAVPVRDFDPPPGDGEEGSDTVRSAADGDPTTVWRTNRYTTTDFGGLKTGVGLLVDLGRVRRVGRVRVTSAVPGAGLELRVADTPGASAADFRTVAAAPASSTAPLAATLEPPAGTTGRYWLVWITSLPRDPGGGYRAGVAELAFD